MVMDFSAVEKR